MVDCLKRGADLNTAQLTPLSLTVSCFSKIQIGFTFLVLAHPGSGGQTAVKRVCVHNTLVILYFKSKKDLFQHSAELNYKLSASRLENTSTWACTDACIDGLWPHLQDGSTVFTLFPLEYS